MPAAIDEQEADFHSDGLRLAGAFYRPSGAPAPPDRPMVVVCSGFMGLRDIHPARFARALVPRGYPCFGFDYRGFGRSDGERGRVLVDEQVRDVANAAAFVRAHPAGEGRPVVLVGWGMGAGLVLAAAAPDGDVAGLACVNGFYDAVRVQRAVRGEAGWRRFLAWLAEARARCARTGDVPEVDPFDVYPLDEVTRGYVDGVLRLNPDFGGRVQLTFADSLLRFRPETWAAALGHVPLLIAHGRRNALHPPEEAESLQRCHDGHCEAHWIEDAGHTEWMHDDHPRFRELAARMDAWLGALGGGAR